jgi:hypothetical protein
MNKKLRPIIYAIATLTGISSAFSFGPKSKTKWGPTYYAVQQGSSFIWVTTQPTFPYFCTITLLSTICTIVTNTVPTDGVVPHGHAPNNKVYRPIPG